MPTPASTDRPDPRTPAAPAGPGVRHLPALDGVRAIAATAVLLTHVGFLTGAVGPTMFGSIVTRLDVGVALFFALSGFLMLRPWIRPAVAGHDSLPSVRAYAVSRASRILPAYWIVTAIVLVAEAAQVYRPTLTSPLHVGLREILVHLVIAQGYTDDFFSSFSQTWSLTTEVAFYLVVPFLGLALVRACRRIPGPGGPAARIQRIERWCVGVMALGVGVAAYSASSLPGASGTLATSLLGHCAWFAAGAWVFARTQRPSGDASPGWLPDRQFAVAGVLLVLAATPLGGPLLLEEPTPFQAGVKEALYTVVAILVVSAATSPAIGSSAVGRVLSSSPLGWLGTRSYALFLCHLPILFGVMTVLGLDLFEGSFVIVGIVTFVLSAAVADLSWRFIERPVLDRAHRDRERQQR